MTDTRRITYPFPLRPGFDAMLELPSDMTEVEADRVANYVRSLAVEAADGLESGRG